MTATRSVNRPTLVPSHLLLRDDEAIRAETFLTWQEALEAAGLSE